MGFFKTYSIDPHVAMNYHQRWDGLRAAPVAVVAAPVAPAPTVPITREAVGKALRHYRKQVAGNDRDTNALNRAALNIEACLWTWNGDVLIVTSASNSRTRYHVTATICECRAAVSGFVCWHRWAWMVLDTARHPQAPQQPAQRVTKDVQKAVDELF